MARWGGGGGIWDDKVTKWQNDEGEGVVGMGGRRHAHQRHGNSPFLRYSVTLTLGKGVRHTMHTHSLTPDYLT
jgi:hypothetical protein